MVWLTVVAVLVNNVPQFSLSEPKLRQLRSSLSDLTSSEKEKPKSAYGYATKQNYKMHNYGEDPTNE